MKNSPIIKRLFLMANMLLFMVQLMGQNHFVFYPIDSKDGLSDNKVRSINQLHDGRIVVITDGIINLYDGSNFKFLHFTDNKTYPLKAYQGHHRTYIDNNNGLWIKNNHQLIYFDIEKETFVSNLDSTLNVQNITEALADIFIDSGSNLWYLTNTNRLYQHSLKTKKSTLFINDIFENSSNQDLLYDLSVVDDQLFLFYKSGLMSCYDLDTHRLLYQQNPMSDERSAEYQQTLMVVNYKNYLYQIRNGSNGGIMLRFNVKNKKWETILNPDYRLNTLTIDENGNSYISTLRGFWFINSNLTEKTYIPKLSLADGKIVDTEISTQYTDMSGGLWIGTLNRGLLYYHPNRFLFRNSGYSMFKNLSTKNLMVNCFAKADNKILIGTNNGLFLKETNGEILINHPRLPVDINCDLLVTDSKKRTWIGASQAGIYCIDKETVNRFTSSGNISAIHEFRDGTLSFFSSEGVYLYNEATNQLQLINSSINKQFGTIKQVIEIENELLLCMSSSNLFILDIKTKSVTLSPLTTKLQTHLTELTNHHLNCIGFDSRGLIWIGTQDGLHVVNRATGREQNLHTDDGLVNNCIQSIIEDSEHRIWVSTANGISRIDTKTDKKQPSFIFTNYNHYDGVLGSEFISRSVFVDDNGEIYWGGIDGFNQINRNRIGQSSPSVQKPILSKLYISGKLVDKSTNFKGAPLLKKSLAATDEIELAHHQNFISVEFSAMNYINPFRTYYRYKLEGFEENWHVTTSTNGVGVATYTNLQPGNYILKMESTNKQNRWKNIHRELVIQIYPPIWQTPLFYALYLLIITIILYLIIKHLTRKNKVKREQQQKEALDQMKYSFFTNVSHELRTPLTLIITPLESIIKKSNDTILQRQLSLIKRNADDLLNLVNQLLDFRKLEMRGEQIQLSYCNLSDLITIVCQSFEEIATSKQIDFKWSSEQVDSAFLDANKLKKVINNLLSNAFKFTPEGGSISLKMTSSLNPVDNAPSFCIEVNDSGCGIPKDKITHIFDRFYQVNRDGESFTGSGIGLHMTKEYIQMHQGVVLVESDINKGSRFTVHIPSQLHPEYQSDNDNEISAEEQTVKLLLVEDNTNFRNFLKEELSEHYTIITACNGYEALEKMHQNNVDMIISDYGMPGMNGYELCHKIKSDINTSHTPFIMLTARTSDKDQMQSFEAGADAFISKPFNMDILLLRIQNLLAKKKERIELFKSAIIIQPQMVTSSTVDEVLIKTALNCIENHMADPNFTVEQLSNEMCMDRTGLFRKLKAVVGQSPSAFLKSVRLKRSATLLEKGLSVSEVAEMVGFSSLSYFSKSFVEEFGVKPSQYFKKREK